MSLITLNHLRAFMRIMDAIDAEAKLDRPSGYLIRELVQEARHYADDATSVRTDYMAAQLALGGAGRGQHVEWTRLNDETTFRWRFVSIDKNLAWMWLATARKWRSLGKVLTLTTRKRMLVEHIMQLAFTAWGVHPDDLRGAQRGRPFQHARATVVAIATAHRCSLQLIGRALDKHPAAINNFKRISTHMLDGITDVKNLGDFRPSPNEQSSGRIQTLAYGHAGRRDRPQRLQRMRDTRGLDRREGQAPVPAGEQDHGASVPLRAYSAHAGDDGQS